MKNELTVARIEKGTVLDHLPAGSAMPILRLFDVGDNRIVMAMNVESTKHGRKDMIKIEGKLLSKDETDKVSLIAPRATINIIKDGRVEGKRRVSPPQEIKGILKCPNKNCITNFEECLTHFIKAGDKYKCRFCESHFSVKDFEI